MKEGKVKRAEEKRERGGEEMREAEKEKRGEERDPCQAVRGGTLSLCCPQQPSSASTATQFATELIGSLMSQKRCADREKKKKKGTRIFLSPRTLFIY